MVVHALQRAISMDPANPMPHQLLGQAYRTLGQTADAERELKREDELTRNPTKPDRLLMQFQCTPANSARFAGAGSFTNSRYAAFVQPNPITLML